MVANVPLPIICESGGVIAPSSTVVEGQRLLRARLIAGDVQGSSGYYPASVIERDGPRVFPKGTHMHLDHQSFFEFMDNPAGSLKDLAAVIDSTPVYEAANSSGPGLYADVRVFSQHADMLIEMAPYIGVSIRAAATTEEGRSPVTGEMTDIITELIAGVSVDFVTHPGADGRIVQILESHKPPALPPGTREVRTEAQPVAVLDGTKKKGRQVAEPTEETLLAHTAALTANTAALTAEAERVRLASEAAAAAAAQASQIDIPQVIATTTEALIASGLGATSRSRVIAAVTGGAELAAAIEAEKASVAAILAEAGVQGGAGTGGFVREDGTGTPPAGTGGLGGWQLVAGQAPRPAAGVKTYTLNAEDAFAAFQTGGGLKVVS